MAKNSKEYLNFQEECKKQISDYPSDIEWKKLSDGWMYKAFKNKYMYNFESLGRPVIQTPIDMIAMQELIWKIKPDLIIETGIAHGGSLIMNASMLAMLDMCEAIDNEENFNPKYSKRKVLGIDIDIRKHNKEAIEKHQMFSRIKMIEGSSISPQIIELVEKEAKNYKKILVCLDSNHTHEHVLSELNAYAPLVSIGSYCVVFDTIVEDMPQDTYPDRPWGLGNNPKTAVHEFLKTSSKFEINKNIQNKLLMTVAPDGYLRRIK